MKYEKIASLRVVTDTGLLVTPTDVAKAQVHQNDEILKPVKFNWIRLGKMPFNCDLLTMFL